MESQIHEGGANGYEGLFPLTEPGRQQRRDQVRKELAARYAGYADTYREALIRNYGEERGKQVKYAQAFEICEYGQRVKPDGLKSMFPH